ncbi:MAG TPA: sensor histidine kinase [Alphaproteobacteria bacterium]
MRLAEFITRNSETIAHEWELFAQTCRQDTDHALWREQVHIILRSIVADMNTYQSAREQQAKSKGERPYTGSVDSPAQTHASGRAEKGFTPQQLISEFRALRATVIRLWHVEGRNIDGQDIEDLTRFNESVDEALAESLDRYTRQVSVSRDMFLGILAHDLRNPLGAIMNSGELIARLSEPETRQAMLSNQIVISALRMERMIADLLELTRVHLGKGIVVQPVLCDMGQTVLEVIEEMKALYPHRQIHLQTGGELAGSWDAARLSQVLSNLIGNAVQHGAGEVPITVRVEGKPEWLVMRVHNEGAVVPQAVIDSIFDSFVQGDAAGQIGSQSLGLGLYISKEIVIAHGGLIEARSNPTEGTIFTASIPRVLPLSSSVQ